MYCDGRLRPGKEIGSKLGRMSKETGKKYVPSPTSPLKNQTKEKGRCAGKKNTRCGKRQGAVRTAKANVKEVEEEMPKDIQKAPPTEVPATDEGGRGVSTSESTTAKKASAVGQAC